LFLVLSVTILDKSGIQQQNLQNKIHKHDIDLDGTVLTVETLDCLFIVLKNNTFF
jgi:hypothetical protein